MYNLNLEYAGSLWDKNRFSDVDDEITTDTQANIFLKVLPTM